MTKWILILTIMAGSGGGSAITHITFASEKACKSAGAAWLKLDRGYSYGFRNAVCVPDQVP